MDYAISQDFFTLDDQSLLTETVTEHPSLVRH